MVGLVLPVASAASFKLYAMVIRIVALGLFYTITQRYAIDSYRHYAHHFNHVLCSEPENAVLRPVACGQNPGTRAAGQGTETLAKLGGSAA